MNLKNYLKNELFEGITSRREFLLLHENGLISKDVACITIHDPDIELHSVDITSKYDNIIQMRFWDVEEDFANYKACTPEEGKELYDFINANKDKKFFIHCMAGQSRSAGVACAVECIVNFGNNVYEYKTGKSDVTNHPRYSPNWMVFDAICKNV